LLDKVGVRSYTTRDPGPVRPEVAERILIMSPPKPPKKKKKKKKKKQKK